FHVGLVLMRQARWEEAEQAYRAAAAQPNALAPIFHNLAYALERLGRLDEARAALDEALRRGADGDPRVLTSRGVLALRVGDLPEATALFAAAREAWGRRTPPAAWYLHAALAAALAGDTERAAQTLEEGAHAHPHAAPLHNNLAAVLERRGAFEAAQAAAERGLLEDASLAQLHKNAGDLHYRAGRYDEALEAYQRAVRANDALGVDVYLKLGNLRFRRQDVAEAERYWARALELDPENAIVRNNLAAVRRTVA
ncbi:MAG TPA: tetratricopeptide repeat protein, partial [Gemmatimonadaceae bacterium]